MFEHENSIQLPDGRALSYSEHGDEAGVPVVLLHGAPGDRRFWQQLPGFPFLEGLRLITPDRPGYGLSDFKPGMSYVDWPDDVSNMADALGVDSFALVGVSGGGPGALACAWKIPERINAVAVVSTPGPPEPEILDALSSTNRRAYLLARRAPWLMRANMKLLAWLQRRDVDRFVSMMGRKLSDVDQAALRQPAVRRALATAMSEDAVTRPAAGYAQDVINQSRPWPFDLSEINAPVSVWQPEDDTSAPPAVGRFLERALPDCTVHVVPRAGHLWHIEHMTTVLRELLDGTTGAEAPHD
jgi:pimeloyl-ACP methyl ester carboxylesterase